MSLDNNNVKNCLSLRLSQFAIPIHKNDIYLIFVSKNCSFFQFDKITYEYILGFNNFVRNNIDSDFISTLRSESILTTEEEDIEYVETLILNNNIQNYSTHTIGLTILPTIDCNLRCPYCFEESKPHGLMSKKTADKLVEFIESHKCSQSISLSWFGGEPLLGRDIIEYLLPKIYSISNLSIKSHSMITNGTLLNEQVSKIFENYPLDSVQITFDGDKKIHNKRRFYNNGLGTYDDIIKNIEKFAIRFPDTNIALRINLDNKNKHTYLDIFNNLSDHFKGYNVSIYPGFLRANRGCENENFFSTEDHINFYKKIWKSGFYDFGYPQLCAKGCSATKTCSYIIGPNGEIYKCWEHVGYKDKIVGSIYNNELSNQKLFNDFIFRGNCLNDYKCKSCRLLPICSGGCPKRRLENLHENLGHELCTVYYGKNGEAIEDILYEYYQNTTK